MFYNGHLHLCILFPLVKEETCKIYDKTQSNTLKLEKPIHILDMIPLSKKLYMILKTKTRNPRFQKFH